MTSLDALTRVTLCKSARANGKKNLERAKSIGGCAFKGFNRDWCVPLTPQSVSVVPNSVWGPRPPPRTKITHGRPATARGRSGGGRNEISLLGTGPITVFAYFTRDHCLRGSLLNVNTLGDRLPIRSRRRRLYSPPTVSRSGHFVAPSSHIHHARTDTRAR